MTRYAGTRTLNDVLLRHKRQIDSLRKEDRGRRDRAPVSVNGEYIVGVTVTPGNGTPGTTSVLLPDGSWTLRGDVYGDYDDIFLSFSSPNIGGWVAHRPSAQTENAWGSLTTSADYAAPTSVTVGGMVAETVAGDLTVTLRLTPR